MNYKWKIEIAERNDISTVDTPLNKIPCSKNPGHIYQIPCKDLELHHLPENHRTNEKLVKIQHMGRRVVRLRVEITETGEGEIVNISNQFYIKANKNLIEDNDIKNCKFELKPRDRKELVEYKGEKLYCFSDKKVLFTFRPALDLSEICKGESVTLKVLKYKYGTGYVGKYQDHFTIKTNNHVIDTVDEVRRCLVHFNDTLSGEFQESRGEELQWTCPFRDVTLFSFSPVPHFLKDMEITNFGTIFPKVIIWYSNDRMYTSCIFCYEDKNDTLLYGINVDINNPDVRDIQLKFPDDTFHSPTSYYILFRPIPQDIISLTRSNCTTLIKLQDKTVSGTCVYLGGRYSIKLDVPATIAESNQMVISFPSNAVSYGTGLFFESKDCKNLFMDKHDPLTVYFFHVRPATKEMKLFQDSLRSLASNKCEASDFCIIAYPHGGIKTVSFGQHLNYSIVRLKEGVDSNEQGLDVPCRNYSCPTCPGCSGAPVFMLASLDAKKTFGTTHAMGEEKSNIGAAWSPASVI